MKVDSRSLRGVMIGFPRPLPSRFCPSCRPLTFASCSKRPTDCIVRSATRYKEQGLDSHPQSVDEHSTSNSGSSSIQSISSSIDDTISDRQTHGSNEDFLLPSGLLATIEEVYDEVVITVEEAVHEAEEGVEEAWVTSAAGKAWAWYTLKLELYPVRTKAVTSFVGFVLGDIAAQKIGGGSVEAIRALRLGMYGLLIDGPVGHTWYKLLDSKVFPDQPASLRAVVSKTAADQLLWAPIMTCVFFAVLKTLEGHPELIEATIQAKLLPTITANYLLWPAAHFVNFRFIPTEHRILYNNVISVAWNAYLSTLSHAPVFDTDGLLDVINQALSFLDGFLPAGAVENINAALRMGPPLGVGHGLEGLKFDIPKSFTLEPTRTLADILPMIKNTITSIKK